MQANINVEVQKAGSESNLALLRRFSKRVQGAGIINRVRGLRYKERNQSPFKRKQATLKRLIRFAERERLEKLGKAPVARKRGRR